MGVWIETYLEVGDKQFEIVTPCVGVWIETLSKVKLLKDGGCHTLRGCVD